MSQSWIQFSRTYLGNTSCCLWQVEKVYGNSLELRRNKLKPQWMPVRSSQAVIQPHIVDLYQGVFDERSSLHFIKSVENKRFYVNKTCSKTFPQSLIIGIQKCGTQAVAQFLNIHPEIAINYTGHTYFFSSNFSLGLKWYLDQLPCSKPGQITIERTPAYFYIKESPVRIHDLLPRVKLLLVVCSPVRRTVSNFAMAKHKGRESKNARFENKLFTIENSLIRVNDKSLYVDKSMYAKHLQKWLDRFPRNQLFAINGDCFAKSPAQELRKVEQFLGLKPFVKESQFVFNEKSGFYCIKTSSKKDQCLPPNKGREHPVVREKYLRMLENYFKPKNEEFFSMLKLRNWF